MCRLLFFQPGWEDLVRSLALSLVRPGGGIIPFASGGRLPGSCTSLSLSQSMPLDGREAVEKFRVRRSSRDWLRSLKNTNQSKDVS